MRHPELLDRPPKHKAHAAAETQSAQASPVWDKSLDLLKWKQGALYRNCETG